MNVRRPNRDGVGAFICARLHCGKSFEKAFRDSNNIITRGHMKALM